jgi:hypothetical protein
MKSFSEDEVIRQISDSNIWLSHGEFSFMTAWKWRSRYSSASGIWQLTVGEIDFYIVAFEL